jgi:hypothetical protein
MPKAVDAGNPAQRYERARLAPCPLVIFAVVVVSLGAVVAAGSHAAVFESGARSRRGRDRSCLVSQIVPFRHG